MIKQIVLKIFVTWFLISNFGCENYQHISSTERFNKKTGETEILTASGEWKAVSQIKKIQNIEREKEWDRTHQSVPYEILQKCNGTLGYSDWGTFTLNMENLSDWVINKVTVTVEIHSMEDKSLLTTKDITYNNKIIIFLSFELLFDYQYRR